MRLRMGNTVIKRGDPHLPQTNMKIKKCYIAATGLAVLTGLWAYGSYINKTCVPGNDDYINGTGVCNAKNLKADSAKRSAEIKRKAHEASNPKKFQINRTSVAMLALDCEKDHIRPFLKDPNSFRELNHSYSTTATHIDVQVNYTATNGFGGRVQESKVCSYTL